MSPSEHPVQESVHIGRKDQPVLDPDVKSTKPEEHDGAPSNAQARDGDKDGKGVATLGDSNDVPTTTSEPADSLKPTNEAEPRPTTPVNKGKQVESNSSQYLAPEAQGYVDPTPPTPTTSQPPSRTPSTTARPRVSEDRSLAGSDAGYDEKRYLSDDEQEGGSRSEIQSIMEQFSEAGGGPGAEEVMSPRLELTSPILGSPPAQHSQRPQHPPRKSSLEPLSATLSGQMKDMRLAEAQPTDGANDAASEEPPPPVPPKDGSFSTPAWGKEEASPSSPHASVHRPPPPAPEPEPAQPFDFHRFLEQLRNKKADPVARYLKSFLQEFGKKQWMVHEQVKIIGDFLAFIANKMAQCEVWANVSDAEFDNAREGMEKLVMNRLYAQTFSPAIPAPRPVPGAKPKRKGGDAPLGPGRRGQHQEDVERDDILAQKIKIYGWVKEEHLDIPQIGDSGSRFLKLAQQELLKIKSYRAPRDKIICVLNCCKVIFGLLKHNKSDGSADSFMPMLIYVVLQANPDHLVSNVQYILRFRNQDKLGGEAGYYLSSLMGAVQFVESMDRTSLTITDEEFEKSVEAAVSAFAEKHQANSPSVPQEPIFDEKGRYVPPGSRVSQENARPDYPPRSTSLNTGGSADDTLPIGGLLKTIQRPLTSIGRMFTDDGGGQSSSETPQLSHGLPPPPRGDSAEQASSRHTLSAEEAAARQASAETAEAQRLSRAEHANVVETLSGMFPDLAKDIISDVVHQKEGRVGLAVDACLALSS